MPRRSTSPRGRPPLGPLAAAGVALLALHLQGCDDLDPRSEPDPAQVEEEAPPPVAALEPTPAPSPEDLRGMTDEAVAALLGRPTFTRDEPPALFWRYRTPRCLFELYFYRRGGMHRLSHIEARAAPGAGARGGLDVQECLALVLRARRG